MKLPAVVSLVAIDSSIIELKSTMTIELTYGWGKECKCLYSP